MYGHFALCFWQLNAKNEFFSRPKVIISYARDIFPYINVISICKSAIRCYIIIINSRDSGAGDVYIYISLISIRERSRYI